MKEADETAFQELIEPHRSSLHVHCYRMLGSVDDADDALQDAMLRAWRGLGGFEGRSAPRSWLYRITTNACLDLISRRKRRVLPVGHGPPIVGDGGDPSDPPLAANVWVEPYPDEQMAVQGGHATPEARYEQREAVELAFIAALQRLPGRQRAVLILREVLGFSAAEVAEAMGSTSASVNSALQRARKAIDERLPDRSQQVTMRALGDRDVRDLVKRFVDAFEQGDVDAIMELLAEDATFAMPPFAQWARGREAIGKSWLMPSGPPPRLRYVPTSANGQLALGTYALHPTRGVYEPIALDVLTLRGGLIGEVIAFRSPGIFPRFGLPEELADRPG